MHVFITWTFNSNRSKCSIRNFVKKIKIWKNVSVHDSIYYGRHRSKQDLFPTPSAKGAGIWIGDRGSQTLMPPGAAVMSGREHWRSSHFCQGEQELSLPNPPFFSLSLRKVEIWGFLRKYPAAYKCWAVVWIFIFQVLC